MIHNILEYLEGSARRVPDRVAFTDERETITFAALEHTAKAIGSALAVRIPVRSPVAVLMDPRNARCVAAFLGIVYAGSFYVPLDPAMPAERLAMIIGTLQPAMILHDRKCVSAVESLHDVPCGILAYDEAVTCPHDIRLLNDIRVQSSVYDLLTVLYTSGSTGIPKGVTQSQFSFLHYTEATIEVFGFTEDTVFGNQSPFFYANSIIDIYPPMALGASVYLLPANVLMFPKRFVECLNEAHVTELTMTPSSYVQIANSGTLSANALPHLKHVIMSGEAMPWRQMSQWMEAAPDAGMYNFYGSTEMFSVAVYKIDRTFTDGEIIPVGKPYKPVHIMFLTEEGEEMPRGEAGEMYIANPWLSSGYYRDAVRTNAVFVSDPLGRGYAERFYRTGDLGRFNDRGELIVLGRKDTQIKHMGYRMELGEVEYALRSLPDWRDGCCLFDREAGQIYCFWDGELTQREIVDALREKLPKYMLPDQYVHLDELPHTANMKIDRVRLQKYYKSTGNVTCAE